MPRPVTIVPTVGCVDPVMDDREAPWLMLAVTVSGEVSVIPAVADQDELPMPLRVSLLAQ